MLWLFCFLCFAQSCFCCILDDDTGGMNWTDCYAICDKGRVVAIISLSLCVFHELLRADLLRPTDGCCFCLRTRVRKPQQTDGRYWDLLIKHTLTFKALSLSLSLRRGMNPTPHPVNPTSSQPQCCKHSVCNKQSKNMGHMKDRNLEKMLCETLFFLLFFTCWK